MTVADEVGGAVSAVYWTNKGAVAVVKGGHRKAQEYGMRYQNWRHRGAGKGAGETPEANVERENMRHRMAYDEVTKVPTTRPKGKHWTTESTDETTTYYHHTKSTRKESR